MAIIVQKYGGSSIADAQSIRNVAKRIVERKNCGDSLVVVVSAMADTTDDLIELAHSVVEKPPEREYDMLLTAGERISMALLSMAIQDLNEQAVSFTGSQSGIITDDDHTRARIIDIKPIRIIETLNQGKIAIIAGFQGVSARREVTTLGRGGSDTTAVGLAAVLGAEICEIYTDVQGIYSADPSHIKDAQLLELITYNEALDLTYFGAGVLHSRAVELARVWQVPVRILSSTVKGKGTVIVEKKNGMERSSFVGLSRREDIGLCKVKVSDRSELIGFLRELEKNRVRIGFPKIYRESDYWTVNFWIGISERDRLETIENIDLQIQENVCLISMVGEEIAQRGEVLCEIMGFLNKKNIEPRFIEASQVSVYLVIDKDCGIELENSLHNHFIKKKTFDA